MKTGGIYRHFSEEELATDTFDYAWKLTLDGRMQGQT